MKTYLDDGLFVEIVDGKVKIGTDQDPDLPVREVFIPLEAYDRLVEYVRKSLNPKTISKEAI